MLAKRFCRFGFAREDRNVIGERKRDKLLRPTQILSLQKRNCRNNVTVSQQSRNSKLKSILLVKQFQPTAMMKARTICAASDKSLPLVNRQPIDLGRRFNRRLGYLYRHGVIPYANGQPLSENLPSSRACNQRGCKTFAEQGWTRSNKRWDKDELHRPAESCKPLDCR